MTSKNTETVPYNFSEIYTKIQKSFENRGYDTTEGSDTSQLLTAMSYMISTLNANTSVNINETILTESYRRDSVFINARNFGYEAQHITSYRYTLTLLLESGSHIIPKYAEFNIGAFKYYYYGKQLEFTVLEDSIYINIDVTEGILHTYENNESLNITTVDITLPNGEITPQYYVDIPLTDVEHSGIEAYLTYYDKFGRLVSREPWKQATYYVIDDSNSLNKQFIRMDNIEFKTPRLYFKYAGTGTYIRSGSIIELNVLVSSGTNGSIDDITDTDSVKFDLGTKISCTKIKLASLGVPEETIESVKENAPKFYNSANRCVTTSDYKSFCDRQTTVYKSFVWGGDDEYPKVPGHIWYTFAPMTFEREFTYDEEKNNNFFTYDLNNSYGVVWDYSLDSESDDDKDAYKLQHDKQQEFYSKRYIEDDEIRSSSINDEGEIIDPGIWDVINDYKVPTMAFHNRNPLYIYFDYNVSILKYSISDSKYSIHKEIFDKIDNFFTGVGDVANSENYEIDYYNSSLDSRIYEVLGDKSGYEISLTTKLLINEKTISTETSLSEVKDLYIPLSCPYENYFDSNGYLLTDILPSIDTTNFINYSNTNEIGNIYTDWSKIKNDIKNNISQKDDNLIVAQVLIDIKNKIILTQADVDEDVEEGVLTLLFDNMKIQPDDLTELDEMVPNVTYDNTLIKINDTIIPNSEYNGWYVDYLKGSNFYLIGVEFKDGDILTIEQPQICGMYYLFNDYKKYIQVHLYVNGSGYSEDDSNNNTPFTSPKSYIYSKDSKYIVANDTYYITSDGYVTDNESSVNDSTIIGTVSLNNYSYSGLSMNLFRQSRMLNLKYESDSFSVRGSIMPRLRSVNFEKRV